jgi:hypothetical protein
LPELLSPVAELQIGLTFVYISEAHAEDKWPIGNTYRTDTSSPLWSPAYVESTTLDERIERILFAKERFKLPSSVSLIVDCLSLPNVESLLGGWPTGFYLFSRSSLQSLILEYQVLPKHGMFELTDLWKWIRSRPNKLYDEMRV